MHKCVIKKVKLINHDCLPILMLLYTMLYIVLAYLMLFAALTNSVCLNNASFFFLFKYFLCQGYELSGEIALKNNHYYYYYLLLNSGMFQDNGIVSCFRINKKYGTLHTK